MEPAFNDTDRAVLAILRDGKPRSLDEIGALYEGVVSGTTASNLIGRARALQLGRDGYVTLRPRHLGDQSYAISPVGRERLTG